MLIMLILYDDMMNEWINECMSEFADIIFIWIRKILLLMAKNVPLILYLFEFEIFLMQFLIHAHMYEHSLRMGRKVSFIMIIIIIYLKIIFFLSFCNSHLLNCTPKCTYLFIHLLQCIWLRIYLLIHSESHALKKFC